jgi:hypothetical protein
VELIAKAQVLPFFEPDTVTSALNAMSVKLPEPLKEKLPVESKDPLTDTFPPTSPAPIAQVALKLPLTAPPERLTEMSPVPGKPPKLIGIFFAETEK